MSDISIAVIYIPHEKSEFWPVLSDQDRKIKTHKISKSEYHKVNCWLVL